MARKRRKRRARKRRSNPKRKVIRRRKRRHAVAAAPRRRRKRRANPSRPRRRRAKRRHVMRARPRRRRARRAFANPFRRKRRHRRNPGVPLWGQIALAGIGGLAAFAVVNAGSFAATQRIDPTLATLQRNRYIASGLAVIGGAVLALKGHPLAGAAVAAAGACSGLGTPVTLQLGKVLDKAPATTPAAAPGVAAVYGQDMRAVFAQNLQGYDQIAGYLPMAAVYSDDMRGMGDFRPNAPWSGRGPF